MFLRREKAPPPQPEPAATGDVVLHRFSGPTMGTVYRATVATAADVETLGPMIHAAVSDVDARMSNWKPDSEVSVFNRAAPGAWHGVSADLAHVVKAGLAVGRATGGAFDMTLGALTDAWGFGPSGRAGLPEGPGPQAGFQALEVRDDPPALRKSAGVSVDLCGIAKGFGVDRIAAVIEAAGIADYLVEIDGEVRVSGRKPGLDGAWTLAMEAPVTGRREVWDVWTPATGALATSGDYRHFREVDGRRVSHTMDGRTGQPVGNAIASVTVFDASCMIADAWATALMVLGPGKGVAIAQARNIPALFLLHDGTGFRPVPTGPFGERAITR